MDDYVPGEHQRARLLDMRAYRRFGDGEMESVTADEDSLSQSLGALGKYNQRIAEPVAAT